MTAAPGSTGSQFDVLLSNTRPAAVTVAAFSFHLSVSNPEIVFTLVDSATVVPYIFAGHSLFAPAIGSLPDSQSADAADLYDTPLAGALLPANASARLGRVTFDPSSGASPGIYTVTLSGFPSSSLSDPDVNEIPIDQLINGSITVTSSGSATVTEPSTALLLNAAAGATLLRRCVSPS